MESSATPTTTTTTHIPEAPMIDATRVRSSSTRSRTRIEGMDKLSTKDRQIDAEYANMTEAERQMREEELSFYSASDNDHGDDNIWGLLSGVGGNIYEWYVLYRVQYSTVVYRLSVLSCWRQLDGAIQVQHALVTCCPRTF